MRNRSWTLWQMQKNNIRRADIQETATRLQNVARRLSIREGPHLDAARELQEWAASYGSWEVTNQPDPRILRKANVRLNFAERSIARNNFRAALESTLSVQRTLMSLEGEAVQPPNKILTRPTR
jgi:hypothetical protein